MNSFRNSISNVDLPLLVSSLCLIIIGILLIYSADHSQGIKAHFTRQVYVSLASIILLLITVSIPPRFYYALAYIFYLIGIIGLLLVMIMGIIGFGAKRWLVIGGLAT